MPDGRHEGTEQGQSSQSSHIVVGAVVCKEEEATEKARQDRQGIEEEESIMSFVWPGCEGATAGGGLDHISHDRPLALLMVVLRSCRQYPPWLDRKSE